MFSSLNVVVEMSNLVPPQVVVDTPRPQNPTDSGDFKGLISISLSNFVRPKSPNPQGRKSPSKSPRISPRASPRPKKK